MAKLCPKIILEGTRLTHKTDLAFALNEYPPLMGERKYRYHAPLISAEWCGFTNFPWGRGPINFAPEEEQRAMETYATWARLVELMPFYSWVVDRFHISTQMHQKLYAGRDYDFSWLEERLERLGFCLVHCTRRVEDFPRAREERLKVSGNPSQYDDLSVFYREQDCLRDLVSRSRLPKLELDVSDDDIVGACRRVTEWMASIDKLHMPDSW